MTSIKLGSLLAVLAMSAGMLIAQEKPSVFIDEAKIHAVLRNGTTAVIVPVSNTSDHSIKAVLSLAWLSVDEMESSSISKEVALQPGHLEIETPLPLVDPSIWTRLRYSMSPDRVLFYLWPRAEGVAFSFNVSARMAMAAKSAPSILYDYYNPEALSELPPVRWLTK